MKQGQGSKRARGRNGGRRGGNRQHLFDSNGPSVRIRGNAVQVHEKYLGLARDAASSGDRVAAENYYQHAEHYFRIYSTEQEERTRHGVNGQGADGSRRQGTRGQRGSARSGANGANGSGDHGPTSGENVPATSENADATAADPAKSAQPAEEPDGSDKEESERGTAAGD
jgi:hypothetical protein